MGRSYNHTNLRCSHRFVERNSRPRMRRIDGNRNFLRFRFRHDLLGFFHDLDTCYHCHWSPCRLRIPKHRNRSKRPVTPTMHLRSIFRRIQHCRIGFYSVLMLRRAGSIVHCYGYGINGRTRLYKMQMRRSGMVPGVQPDDERQDVRHLPGQSTQCR